MANIFKNAERAIGKAAKDTKNAVVKGTRDTVDEGARNLRRPWESAVIGAALTPFTGGLSATALVGGSSLVLNSAARHQNLKGAFKEGGKSTIFGGLGAGAATAAMHAPAIWDAVSTGGKWAWHGTTGVIGKAGSAIASGWHHNSGGAGGPEAIAAPESATLDPAGASDGGGIAAALGAAVAGALGSGTRDAGPPSGTSGGSTGGGGGGYGSPSGDGGADAGQTGGGFRLGMNVPTIALGAGIVVALIFAVRK